MRSHKGAAGASGLCSLIGSLEPLLLARSRQKRRRRRSASLDANAENPDENGEEDGGANTDGDIDDGIWSREFVVPTIVVTEPEMEMVGTRLRQRRWNVLLVLVCYWYCGLVVVVVQHWW